MLGSASTAVYLCQQHLKENNSEQAEQLQRKKAPYVDSRCRKTGQDTDVIEAVLVASTDHKTEGAHMHTSRRTLSSFDMNPTLVSPWHISTPSTGIMSIFMIAIHMMAPVGNVFHSCL